jgi:hypothetical protein
METRLVVLDGPRAGLEACHQHLRRQDPAVVVRLNQSGLAVDPRTLAIDEETLLVDAFVCAWSAAATKAKVVTRG